MSEATITFASHDQIRTLFGAQDQHLRQIRELLGVSVVVRGDELRVSGDEAQVQRGVDVLTGLKDLLERRGRLTDADVQNALSGYRPLGDGADADGDGDDLHRTAIEVFEKAKKVHPRSAGQGRYVRAIQHNDLVFCAGPAGSGKTYLAVAMAVNALRSERVRKIVLVRPAVEAGEKLGFLPGDILAKVNPYLRPLLDALNDILDFEQARRYMENDVIEIVPLAFMRGRTLNNTFIILDEGQNTTVTQMKMFLTRMGQRSKIVVTGDPTQVDLPENVTSGMTDAMQRLAHIDGVEMVRLSGEDIVRHRLVREVVRAYDEDEALARPRKK